MATPTIKAIAEKTTARVLPTPQRFFGLLVCSLLCVFFALSFFLIQHLMHKYQLHYKFFLQKKQTNFDFYRLYYKYIIEKYLSALKEKKKREQK